MYQFNKSKEIERKANLVKLCDRTPDQIKREEALYMELCLQSQLHAELERGKEALCKLLGGLDFSHPGSVRMTSIIKHANRPIQAG